MKPSLLFILERARAILKNSLNRVIQETALPAYLIEGLLVELLAEVRGQKAAELVAEATSLSEKENNEPDKPEEKEE